MKTKICLKPGCGRAAVQGKDYCQRHISLQDSRKVFTKRGKSAKWHSLYETSEWRKRRREFLKKYPICVICGKPATIADHITPHRGDLSLFYDEQNLQPMCQACHSRKTLKENNYFHAKGDRG